MIRIGTAIKRALQQVVGNMQQKASGLFVPPDYVSGKHFGGFSGYTPWIQDCIRAAHAAVRGIGEDELSEISAFVLWQPEHCELTVDKHVDVLRMYDAFAERLSSMTGKAEGLSAEANEQVRRVHGGRQRGALLVIALNPVEAVATGKLNACVSAWKSAEVEEARAVPKQTFLLG